MARGRWIAPAFYDDPDLARCSHGARLLFPALWQLADRCGVFEWEEAKIRKYAFGYDDMSMAQFREIIAELVAGGFVLRATYEGKEYGFCPSMPEWQKFHKDENPRFRQIATGALWCKHGGNTLPTGPSLSLSLVSESLTESESLTGDRDHTPAPKQIADAAETEIATRSESKPKRERKTPTAPAAPQTGYREAVDAWFDGFKAVYGKPPPWGAVQGRQLQNAIKQCADGEVIELIAQFFHGPYPDSIRDGHPLATGYSSFTSRLAMLRADLANPQRRAKAASLATQIKRAERNASNDDATEQAILILESNRNGGTNGN